MRILKLCAATFLILEAMAFFVHYQELLDYIGSVFWTFIPMFVVFAFFVWLFKKILS